MENRSLVFSGAQRLFDSEGRIVDDAYVRRIDQFLSELIWMSRVLALRPRESSHLSVEATAAGARVSTWLYFGKWRGDQIALIEKSALCKG